MLSEFESSRTEEHADISAGWNRDYKGEKDVLTSSSFGFNEGFVNIGGAFNTLNLLKPDMIDKMKLS